MVEVVIDKEGTFTRKLLLEGILGSGYLLGIGILTDAISIAIGVAGIAGGIIAFNHAI